MWTAPVSFPPSFPGHYGNLVSFYGTAHSPWWMIPFSNSACPRLTPSSGLLISPISVSQDTNSLQRGAEHTQSALSGLCKPSASHRRLALSQLSKLLWAMAPLCSAFISCIPGVNACRRLRLFSSLPLAHRQGAHKRKDDLAASIRMMQILILWSNPDIHGGKD